jgi:integrase/recombinase XerD
MAIPTITIYVRHSAGCKHAGDEFARRCDCRKWLRWSPKGEARKRKPANTRSWAEAELVKRDLEDQLSGRAAHPKTEGANSIRACITVFLQDKIVQGISRDATDKYVRETGRLAAYCERQGIYTIQGVSREVLTGYCATWTEAYPSSQTRAIVRARCRSFLRYCYEAQWIVRIPALPKIIVDEPPTMPLTPDEFARILAAVDTLIKDEERRLRARGLLLLMRWTGLALGDALMLRKDQVRQDASGLHRVVTNRQKTGTHVSVPIPPTIAAELLAVPNGTWSCSANGAKCSGNPLYVFWDGKADIVQAFTKSVVAPAFREAGIERKGNMTSHRLRDTFAVDLLHKGVPLEEVSKLLGHDSIKTTERHYSKWVKARQDRLDSLVTASWSMEPLGSSNKPT